MSATARAAAADRLPAVPDDAAVGEVVYDGEVMDEPSAKVSRKLIPAPGETRRFNTGFYAIAGRHAAYVLAGAVVAWRRWRQRRTRHERMMRAAEASGDREALQWWAEHGLASRRDRREGWRAAMEVTGSIVKAAPRVIAVTAAAPGALGILLAVDHRSPLWIAVPYLWAARAASDAVEAASVALTAAEYAALPAAVLALWRLGRTGGSLAPAWATAGKDEQEDGGLVVTADTIVLALQHLRIQELKNALKDGWMPVFDLPPVREGKGYQAAFSLPMGVTAEMLADQRAVLARNLHRELNEVWPTAAGPGKAAVYVLDRGAMEKSAPEYPLLHDGTADVFEGVPGGVTARGDAMLIPVVANNWVAGGQQGQGKSNLCRVMMLGACLDPLCRTEAFVFAGNGDFDAYAPRLAIYRKGATDETVAAAVQRLEELYEEVARREARLAELGAKKLTRKLAAENPDMRPVVTLFSECHELFGNDEHGERAAELAVKAIKRSRKTGIVFGFDTQSSRKGAIPPALVELVSVNCCFYVKTWRSNDGFLGDGAFAAGIRATELRPGRDRGTSLVTGISDAQFDLLRWYFIFVDDDTGQDDAAPVIARAMRMLAPGTPVQATMAPVAAIESRDLLADLDMVLGHERVKLRDAAGLLRQASGSWYRSMTATQLRDDLTAAGVKTVNVSGTFHLDPPELRRVLAEREAGE